MYHTCGSHANALKHCYEAFDCSPLFQPIISNHVYRKVTSGSTSELVTCLSYIWRVITYVPISVTHSFHKFYCNFLKFPEAWNPAVRAFTHYVDWDYNGKKQAISNSCKNHSCLMYASSWKKIENFLCGTSEIIAFIRFGIAWTGPDKSEKNFGIWH